ncbi:DNA-3-methyladenine glycosylase family protein [Fusibacter ferrireducens]|uniref:DNA-(apurinic or apyrimidinic site) lyase n=1 Tax=Fusibacter ferrireducens TaxID=2785058 RepID=A0ABR9ZX15_9FIRM|nr:DNA glycosylase [Fusibacter ferrireducens]MBF4695008.1 8-oxoguanine DNA glycosylase [Fusibacter ferrireducens]
MFLKSNDFNPIFTLECGQCFRWLKEAEQYVGVVNGAIISITDLGQDYDIKIEKALSPISDDFLRHYFDESSNYNKILEVLSEKDDYLKASISAYRGLRLLNQDPFETLITFIISANNNIPKIKMSVEALSHKFGTCIGEYNGRLYYSFPTVEALAEAELEDLKVKGMGYRAKAVSLAAKRIRDEQIDLASYREDTYEAAQTALMQFYGVGEKVADCILLFSLNHKEAFPIDTWVKRMLRTFYNIEDQPRAYKTFVAQYFTEYGGYAQQFLFYYMRESKKGINGEK